MRSRSSHAYDAKIGLQVVAAIPAFLDEAAFFLAELQSDEAPRMNRPAAIDLSPEDRRLVLEILRANLPAETKVWAIGSRASGRARVYSDLDLAIDCGRRLSLDEAAVLREAFTESNLPYRVDFVDWHAIGDGFRRLIAAERVLLTD
jgi:type I restriction enzyme S subunit